MSESDFNEPNMSEFQPPPPPFSQDEYTDETVPEISEVQSLTSIFYEPVTVLNRFARNPDSFQLWLLC